MAKAHDLTGLQVGRLTVLKRATGNRVRWLCRCVCGNEKEVQSNHLQSRMVQSCGCLNSEKSRGRQPNLTRCNTKTGLSNSPTYQSWCSMKQRCQNPRNRFFNYYGGRGITVCDRWQDFEMFFLDMGIRPQGKTLDRIDPNGNYESSNCRWATRSEQQNNRRHNRRIIIAGHEMTVAEAAAKYGITWKLLGYRLDAGWPAELAVSQHKRKYSSLHR